MHYRITLDTPLTHLLSVHLTLSVSSDITTLKLPVWRPGRYEAAHYTKNLLNLSIKDEKGNVLHWEKANASTWSVNTQEKTKINVYYQYFAFALDAGNSYYSSDLLYINFINCLLYVPSELMAPCEVTVDIPVGFKTGCALTRSEDGVFLTNTYYELVDSPLLASDQLHHLNYTVNQVPFNIWIYGEYPLDENEIIAHFEKFSFAQFQTFGEFPFEAYHFLLLVLPYKFYHGVEHGSSTVICLGPGEELSTDSLYKELLGVSSHELFHAWNIIKIRPQEMMPYDFGKSPIFSTGFVAEGFTTYYGDLYLSKSLVFNREAYFGELNTLFNRHFWNYGRLNESVITSSLNLWADGYQPGAPNKKSSIYVEGAMIALMLDLTIRQKTDSRQSLDDVMKLLWVRHGVPAVGYTLADIQHYCEEVVQASLQEFFDQYVYGTEDKQDELNRLLYSVGCALHLDQNPNTLTRHLGIRTTDVNGSQKVIQIAPGSIGENYFSLNDEIVSIDTIEPNEFSGFNSASTDIELKRFLQKIRLNIPITNVSYFTMYSIRALPEVSYNQEQAFTSWCGQSLIN